MDLTNEKSIEVFDILECDCIKKGKKQQHPVSNGKYKEKDFKEPPVWKKSNDITMKKCNKCNVDFRFLKRVNKIIEITYQEVN